MGSLRRLLHPRGRLILMVAVGCCILAAPAVVIFIGWPSGRRGYTPARLPDWAYVPQEAMDMWHMRREAEGIENVAYRIDNVDTGSLVSALLKQLEGLGWVQSSWDFIFGRRVRANWTRRDPGGTQPFYLWCRYLLHPGKPDEMIMLSLKCEDPEVASTFVSIDHFGPSSWLIRAKNNTPGLDALIASTPPGSGAEEGGRKGPGGPG